MKVYAQQPAVTKTPTGIQGFDEITGGGLPRGRTTLVMGGPGCDKTVFALPDVFMAQGKALMGVARWEWEQEERASQERTRVASDLKRLQLQVAQAEAVARLQVVQTEIDARNAEISVLALATGSASKLIVRDRKMLRKLRHGDAEPLPAPVIPKAGGRPRSHHAKTH